MAAFLAVVATTLSLGLIQAVFPFGWPAAGDPMLRERLCAVLLGDLLAASAAGAWAALRRWTAGAACTAGVFVGCAPLLAQAAGLGAEIGLPLAAAGVAGAPFLSGAARAAGPAARALWCGALLAAAGLWWGAGRAAAPFPRSAGEELPAPAPREAALQQRPDVLFLVADTLRADALYSGETPSPELRRLRAAGAWARFATAPSNQTLPSHLTLLCGLDVEKIGMRDNLSPWPSQRQLEERWGMVPLAERFRRAGYRTAAVASNPLLNVPRGGDERFSFAQGFEAWNGRQVLDSWWPFLDWKDRCTWLGWLASWPPAGKAVNQLLRRLLYPNPLRLLRHHYQEGEGTLAAAEAYLETLVRSPRPYFLFVHFMDPHSPYIAPETARGRLDRAETEYRARVQLRHLPVAEQHEAERAAWGRYLRALYDAEVRYSDELAGRLLARVAASGRPTLILFTSDHGEMFGEHGSVEHGNSLYEGEIAVPLILAGPGIPAGQMPRAPELVDAVYSLAQAAGLDLRGLDGRSLFDAAPGRPALAVSRRGFALRDGPWKVVFHSPSDPPPAPGAHPLAEARLYHLEQDPEEHRDLAALHPEIVERLTQELRRRLANDLLPFLPARQLKLLEQRQLNELGYAE